MLKSKLLGHYNLSGWGLYTLQPIRKEQPLGVWYGQIFQLSSLPNWDNYEKATKKIRHILDYSISIEKDLIFYPFDPVEKKLTLFGYLNDAGRKSNVVIRRVRDQLVVSAKRDIEPGEELFFSYGIGYWKSRDLKRFEIPPHVTCRLPPNYYKWDKSFFERYHLVLFRNHLSCGILAPNPTTLRNAWIDLPFEARSWSEAKLAAYIKQQRRA